jgi:Secretion system C-terminal sorting domain
MEKLFKSLLLIIILCVNDSFSANLYSITNGNWSTTGVWSYTPGGATCGCTPIASDNVTINHSVNMDKHLTNVGSNLNGITGILTVNYGGSLLGGNTYDLDIRSTGRLILCGTLTARDIVFSNGSIVNVCLTGSLTVNGDFQNKNNSNSITIDGSLTVNGSYENGNGGTISGSGTISITNGPVINTGSTYGCEGYDPCAGVFPCQVISPCLSPLPVSLLSLQAEWRGSNVQVSWATASEVNNDYFDVLRSIDADYFQSAGRVKGSGTTSQLHSYSFSDTELPPLQNVLYYRLRQVDYDGMSALSSIAVATKKDKASVVTVFPNPYSSSDDHLNVTLQNVDQAQISLMDTQSRLVYETTKKNLAPSSLVKLPLNNLASGVYMLKILTPREMHAIKLVVRD